MTVATCDSKRYVVLTYDIWPNVYLRSELDDRRGFDFTKLQFADMFD